MTRFLVLCCFLVVGCGKDDAGANGKKGGADDGDSFQNRDGIEIVECNDRFRSCGGDPTGSWEIYAMCDPGVDVKAICNKAEATVTEDRSEGSIDLNPNGSWERVYKVDIDYDITVPASCLGGLLSCSVLENLSGTIVKKCKEKNNGGCNCTGSFKTTVRKDGDWEQKGDGYVTDDGRTDFCIDGDIMDTVDEEGVRVLWR